MEFYIFSASLPKGIVWETGYYVTTMAMKRVGAREANQQFSALLAAAERDGDTVIITRRGKPIARLIPEPRAAKASSKTARIRALLAKYSRPMSYVPEARESLYDRDRGEKL